MNINPKPDANFRARSCLAQSVACKPRKLKVRGSIPGQSINPFCRCPHFLRESDRASRLSGFSGALAKKMKTSTKGIYGLTGDRAWYFQLTKLTSYRLSHTGFWLREMAGFGTIMMVRYAWTTNQITLLLTLGSFEAALFPESHRLGLSEPFFNRIKFSFQLCTNSINIRSMSGG